MPCQGTDGKVQTKALAGVDLQGQLTVGALHNEQQAQQTKDKAWGFERSTIASVDLGDQLSIDGDRRPGQRHPHRGTDLIALASRAPQIGTITANGEKQTFPDTGAARDPGRRQDRARRRRRSTPAASR